MSYTPNTWAAGDTVTAAKLNNLEQGVANAGVTIVYKEYNSSTDTWALNATAASVWQAYQNGVVIIRTVNESYTGLSIITYAGYNPTLGSRRYMFSCESDDFIANSDSEHPHIESVT